MNNEAIKIWLSSTVGMEVKNPFHENLLAGIQSRRDQYERDKNSELPSWMGEKLFMAIQRTKRYHKKKTLISKIKDWFKK